MSGTRPFWTTPMYSRCNTMNLASDATSTAQRDKQYNIVYVSATFTGDVNAIRAFYHRLSRLHDKLDEARLPLRRYPPEVVQDVGPMSVLPLFTCIGVNLSRHQLYLHWYNLTLVELKALHEEGTAQFSALFKVVYPTGSGKMFNPLWCLNDICIALNITAEASTYEEGNITVGPNVTLPVSANPYLELKPVFKWPESKPSVPSFPAGMTYDKKPPNDGFMIVLAPKSVVNTLLTGLFALEYANAFARVEKSSQGYYPLTSSPKILCASHVTYLAYDRLEDRDINPTQSAYMVKLEQLHVEKLARGQYKLIVALSCGTDVDGIAEYLQRIVDSVPGIREAWLSILNRTWRLQTFERECRADALALTSLSAIRLNAGRGGYIRHLCCRIEAEQKLRIMFGELFLEFCMSEHNPSKPLRSIQSGLLDVVEGKYSAFNDWDVFQAVPVFVTKVEALRLSNSLAVHMEVLRPVDVYPLDDKQLLATLHQLSVFMKVPLAITYMPGEYSEEILIYQSPINNDFRRLP